jgi:K+-sensing histidine kinase KdpD
METNSDPSSLDQIAHYLIILIVVAITTGLMMLIGREKLGEAVIALLYLVPVGWSASRWGQGPGIVAAISAALAFDYFFIPPFLTFAVARLEGWLVLVIFLSVAILVVGRIQSSLNKAWASEREAMFMYELSKSLSGLHTQEATAYTIARFIQERYLAELVMVTVQSNDQSKETIAIEPQNCSPKGKPERILPILNAWGLIGEISIWSGRVELPSAESRLFRNFSLQAGQALERTRSIVEPVSATLTGNLAKE